MSIHRTSIDISSMEIISWNIVGHWTFNTDQQECTICRNRLTEPCAKCLESPNIEKEVCRASKGRCNHVFHHHCIKEWLGKGKQICPTDATPWRYQDDCETMTRDKRARMGLRKK